MQIYFRNTLSLNQRVSTLSASLHRTNRSSTGQISLGVKRRPSECDPAVSIKAFGLFRSVHLGANHVSVLTGFRPADLITDSV